MQKYCGIMNKLQSAFADKLFWWIRLLQNSATLNCHSALVSSISTDETAPTEIS